MHTNIIWIILFIIFLIHLIGYFICLFLLYLPCRKGRYTIGHYYAANMASPFLTPKVERFVHYWKGERFCEDHLNRTTRIALRIIAFLWEVLIIERILFFIYLCIMELIDFFNLIDYSDCSSKEDK